MAATMNTSAPTYAKLTIRFIENLTDGSNDDWVNIVPIHHPNATLFSQEYRILSRLGGTKFVSKVTGGSSLLDYIESILRLVSADDRPCKQVQFDIPNVPSILVNHSRIRNRIPEVLDMMRQVVESWPQQGTELQSVPAPSVFANVNWNATATPFVPSSRPPPVTIPPFTWPPFNWNTTSREPSSHARRHMHFDEDGNEIIDLTIDSDSE
jgi:hypothetical protein